MAELKRDRVNRQFPVGDSKGAVILPIDCSLETGTVVRLKNVVEREIDCGHRDPNQMYDPHLGNGVGDAVLDAALSRSISATCDAGMGSIAETFYILAEDGGIITHGGIHYLLEHEKSAP